MQRYGTILASMPSLAVQSSHKQIESRGTVNPSNQSTGTAPGGLLASILNKKSPWAAKGLGLIPRFHAGRSARTPPPNAKAGDDDFGEGSEVTVDQGTFSISSDNKRTWTYKEACKLGWVEAAPTDLGTVMMFRYVRGSMEGNHVPGWYVCLLVPKHKSSDACHGLCHYGSDTCRPCARVRSTLLLLYEAGNHILELVACTVV
jgi:hypothetical protein